MSKNHHMECSYGDELIPSGRDDGMAMSAKQMSICAALLKNPPILLGVVAPDTRHGSQNSLRTPNQQPLEPTILIDHKDIYCSVTNPSRGSPVNIMKYVGRKLRPMICVVAVLLVTSVFVLSKRTSSCKGEYCGEHGECSTMQNICVCAHGYVGDQCNGKTQLPHSDPGETSSTADILRDTRGESTALRVSTENRLFKLFDSPNISGAFTITSDGSRSRPHCANIHPCDGTQWSDTAAKQSCAEQLCKLNGQVAGTFEFVSASNNPCAPNLFYPQTGAYSFIAPGEPEKGVQHGRPLRAARITARCERPCVQRCRQIVLSGFYGHRHLNTVYNQVVDTRFGNRTVYLNPARTLVIYRCTSAEYEEKGQLRILNIRTAVQNRALRQNIEQCRTDNATVAVSARYGEDGDRYVMTVSRGGERYVMTSMLNPGLLRHPYASVRYSQCYTNLGDGDCSDDSHQKINHNRCNGTNSSACMSQCSVDPRCRAFSFSDRNASKSCTTYGPNLTDALRKNDCTHEDGLSPQAITTAMYTGDSTESCSVRAPDVPYAQFPEQTGPRLCQQCSSFNVYGFFDDLDRLIVSISGRYTMGPYLFRGRPVYWSEDKTLLFIYCHDVRQPWQHSAASAHVLF